jgi:ligand-binding sensor domain-containing protein
MKKETFYISIILCFVFFIFSSLKCLSQTSGWDSYNPPTVIYDGVFEDNYIWLVSNGGITKFDTITGESIFYNQFNSGLPTPNVFCVGIDSFHNKWFGTGGGPNGGNVEAVNVGNGLVKFDGTNWTTYKTSNSGLPNNTVRAIHIDAAGVLWLGTYSGLAKYDGLTWVIYNKSNSGIPSDSVTAIAEDNNGVKWIGTFKGCASFDGTNWSSHSINNSVLPGDTIRAIEIGPNNEKWLGTSRGIGKYNDTIWSAYTTSNSGLPFKNVTAILAENNGNTWFGTYGVAPLFGGGLTKFDGNIWTTYNSSNSNLPKNNVSVILSDLQGNKWLTTERGQGHGGGIGELNRFDGVNWQKYSITRCGHLSNYCYKVAIKGNDLWFGGEKSGLTKFDGIDWTNYNSENSTLIDDDVLDIQFDSSEVLWAVHDWGKLFKLVGNSITTYTTPGAGGDKPKCLLIDSTQKKWIGMNGTGVAIWNDTVWTYLNMSNSGLPNNNVFCMADDILANRWFATYGGGVAKYDGSNWVVYNTSNSGLLTNNINYVLIDHMQNKWFATQNGLAKFDGTNWTVYRTNNSGLPSNVVYCVSIDSNGILWVGTAVGVAKFDGFSWTSYNFTIPALMPFKNINFDNLGNTWIGTIGRGIVKVSPDSIVTNITVTNLIHKEVLVNYPNPFSEETNVSFNTKSNQENPVVEVYDVLGNKVNCMYSFTNNSGESTFRFFANGLANGTYFFKIICNDEIKSGKMIVFR